MSSVDRPRAFRLIGAYGAFVVLTAMLIGAVVTAGFGYGLSVVMSHGDDLGPTDPVVVGLVGSAGFTALVVYLGLRAKSASIVVEGGRVTYYTKPGSPKVSESLADVISLKSYPLGHTLSYEVLFAEGKRIRFGGDIPEAQALVQLIEKGSGKSF